jgi:probable F420-dependent oxidoreductase
MAELVAFYANNSLGSDPTALRDYAQAVEGAGYARMAMGEHVLGADPNRPGGWAGPYTHENEWQEPFPTFGYLAAVTERIELMTGILILPQRQTVLVAKQAAQVDVLLGGRLVLGVGTGWNPVEYHALGQDFHTRGRRMEEQIGLLRQLWRDPVVTFEGRWDQVDLAGINPLPPRRDIPIWMGGGNPRAVARAGRLGDGWFPLGMPREAIEAGLHTMRTAAEAAGRDPSTLGLQCSVMATGDVARDADIARGFQELGATHLAYFTSARFDSEPGAGLQDHLDTLTSFAEAMRA